MDTSSPNKINDTQYELKYFQYIFNLGVQKLQEKQKSQTVNHQSAQPLDQHRSSYRPNYIPLISHQPSYSSKPIEYRSRMSPSNDNTTRTTIPSLMNNKNSFQQNSPTVLPSGFRQQSQQQNKSPAISSPATRRRLNDSGESQHPQQHKKHRTNAEFPMNNISEHLSSNFSSEPPRGSSSVLAKQQQSTVDNRFTLVYLKRAISNNLPCFYLQFEEDLTIDQLPSTTEVATELNQIFSNKWKSSFKGFTICSLLEKNRFKIGTNDKIDYFNLINTKWPDEIDNNVVKLNKSNYSPDYFAFVVRYVSSSMSKEQVIKYIYHASHMVQFPAFCTVC
ncbi:unnamed protein product [Rotaria sp. Silwood1]|nr:unnamed protein product [Rotaria sp. Silwood1]